jgi:CheY-like chemotaxis protein
LVAQLVARGHQVTATTTGPAKLDLLAQLGADGVVMDGLDEVAVGEAVAKARPDAIVHEMTGLSVAHAGKIDMRHFDRWFATTNRLRYEGTAGCGRSDRRIPFRRAELRGLERDPQGRMGEDRG